MKMDRKELKPKSPPKPDTWDNDAKAQASLEMGSSEYKEYAHDAQMNSATQQGDVSASDMTHIDDHAQRDEIHEKAVSHVETFASRDKNESHAHGLTARNDRSQATNQQKLMRAKAYAHIKKNDLEAEAMREAMKHAAETPTLEDDKLVQRRLPKTLETIKYDDGITEDDFLPKALKKYT